jgi:hypothetical protein
MGLLIFIHGTVKETVIVIAFEYCDNFLVKWLGSGGGI